MTFSRSRAPHLGLLLLMGVYLALALPGLRYGLPDNTHLYPYNCDETMWVMAHNYLSTSKSLITNPQIIQPTFYLWIYLGALKAAGWAGYFDETRAPRSVIPTRFVFARLYLVGRWLQILFGLGLLAVLWITAFRLDGPWAAFGATALLAVCPGMIATSHFSYTNLPVTALSFVTLALCLWEAERGFKNPLWMRGAAVIAGLACATKYTALTLAVPLALAGWRRQNRMSFLASMAGAMALGFAVGCPFAWITPRTFWEGAQRLSDWLRIPIPGLWDRLSFPFCYPFPYCLGPAFWAAGLLAVLWGLGRRDRGVTLLLTWLAALLLGAYRVQAIASPARVLPAAPVFALLLGRMGAELLRRRPSFRAIIGASYAVVWTSTLLVTLTIVRLHGSEPIQKRASRWIWEHIPAGTPIAGVDEAFFWTPDILYPKAPDLIGFQPPYPYKVALTAAEARRWDYLLIAHQQRGAMPADFLAMVDAGREFERVVDFKRELRFGSFVWERVETPLRMPEDDLWAYSLTIYRKRR